MRYPASALVVVGLVLGATCSTKAQEMLLTPVFKETEASTAEARPEPLPAPSSLPSPLVGLGPQSSAEYRVPAPAKPDPATPSGPGVAAAAAPESLPTPAEVLSQLPIPDVAPSAIAPFTSQERSARLVRGDEVVVLSNSALRNSGVFSRALQNSATLAQQYHELQARTLQVQGLAQATTMGASSADVGELRSQLNVALADQARAEAQFETDLWNYGLNGAKVGTITSSNQSTAYAAAEPARYVMVQAIGPERQNNLGYTRTVVYQTGEFGATTVPSEYLLPLPVEANDFFYDRGASNYVQRAPDGWMIPLTADPAINPVLQGLVEPRGLLYYDTGFVVNPGASNFAENVSLGSRNALGAGQTFLTGATNPERFPLLPQVNLAMNAQAMDVGGGNSLQFFTVANNDLRNDVLDVSSLGARLYNRSQGSFFEGWSLLIGQKQTVFGELAATPSGADGARTLIGTVNRPGNIAQFSVEAPISNYLSTKIGIEDPAPGQNDVFYPAASQGTFTQLNRYPTLATSLDLHDRARINHLQLGGLLRSNGYELNATNEEFFATGWGVSAIAQFERGNSTNFVGVAGGEGVGQYLEGVRYSIVTDPAIGSIESIAAYGAYAGRSIWFYDECNKAVAVINAAYGYSLSENPEFADPAPNRKLHQAWINYTRFFGKRLGVGIEYQYGYREVVSGDIGEDHRAMMVVSVRSSDPKRATNVESYAYAPAAPSPPPFTGEGGEDPELLPPLPQSTSAQMQAVGATVDGRPIEEVVRQFQRGGAAFQQGL
jgi:hypothetical protein